MFYSRELIRQSLSPAEIEKLPPAFSSEEFAVAIIRDVVSRCWVTTPKEIRTVSEVAQRVQHLVDRALQELEQDLASVEADEGKDRKRDITDFGG